MTVLAIEIADAGLAAATESGPAGPPSPGFAVLDRGDIRVGEPARATSRLRPRHTNHRYWDRLDRDTVGRPFPRGLTHADLVHAHLSSYWSELRDSLELSLPQASVLFAVPGSYSESQLGLLLGIARACDMPVTGLVDAPLAALDGIDTSAEVVHLDVRLHRTVLTVFDSGTRRRRRQVLSVEGAGLVEFQRTWVEQLAKQFVRETRFDPLHGARSEQALYDALPGWLAHVVEHGSVVAELDGERQQPSIEVAATQLESAGQPLLDEIRNAGNRLLAEGDSPTLAFSSRAAAIPGLPGHLAGLTDQDSIRLPEGAAAAGAIRHRDLLVQPGRQLSLVLGLHTEPHG